MRGRRLVWLLSVFALVYLAASALPVGALQTNTAVGAQNTTAADFNSATTLDNVTVSGSGSAAFVKYPIGGVVDDFEDGDINIETAGWTGWNGDTQNFTATSNDPISGSFSGNLSTEDDIPAVQASRDTGSTSNLSVTINISGPDTGNTNDNSNIEPRSGGAFIGNLAFEDGDEPVTWFNGSGNEVVMASWSPGVNYTVKFDFDFAADTTDIYINGTYQATVDNRASVSNWDELQIRSDTRVSGASRFVLVDDVTEDAAAPDTGTYLSQTLSVDNAETAKTNLSNLNNVTAHVTVLADTNGDGTFGTTAASNTYTTDGNKSLDISGTDSTDWRFNVTFESTGASPTAELHDVTIEFTNHEPEVGNGSASPTGDISSGSPTLEIQINDTEFSTAQGDSIDVEFFVDGSSIGTDTLSNNGTASQTASGLMGGSHTWHAVASDSYGLSNTSETFSISTPSNLTVRKELAPDELVDGVTINATIYYGDEVETRTSTTGNISLVDFPTNEPLTVRINASGYYTRTAVIEDVFEQQSMYLLNDTEAAYLVRFDLSDPTGNFPREDTVLFIERDLNQSSTTDWRIIAGDNFGVQGVPVDLDRNERYRLRIKNLESGDTNTIGGFTAIQAETVTISAGSASIEIQNSTRSYNWEARENETAQTISVEYNDTADQTEEIKITIHERFNKSNVIVDNATYTNTNNLVHQVSLTNQQVNETWMAELYVDRGDGFVHYRVPVSGGPRTIVPADLDQVWVTAVGVFIVLITGMAFSQLNQGVGAVVTSLVGGILWYLGVLSGVTIGPAVVAALGISVVFHYRQGGG